MSQTPQQSPMIGQIAAFAHAWQLAFDQVGDRITLTRVVAERKAFLSTARLKYLATITLDAAGGELRFSEMLKESGAGLTSGGDDGDFGSTSGFGFQKTSYNTRTDTIADSIEEQARSLGAKYANQFPYREIRIQVNRIAEAGGYAFRYGVR